VGVANFFVGTFVGIFRNNEKILSIQTVYWLLNVGSGWAIYGSKAFSLEQ
jgi:hypothetical protein